jgi:WD40 repeat protein
LAGEDFPEAIKGTERRKNEGKVQDYKEIKHLKGHKFGIESLKFSPKNDFLISLGDAEDRGLFVWDWYNEKKITCNKLGKPVLSIAISED